MKARKTEAPAGPLHDQWNVVNFPDRKERVRLLGRNAKLRRRYVELSKTIDSFYRIIHEATGSKRFNHAFCMLDAARQDLWQEMVRAGILYDIKT